MTIKSIQRAVYGKKPAIIKERGFPRYVILDWKTYKKWEDAVEDTEDSKRLTEALSDPRNQKRIKFSRAGI